MLAPSRKSLSTTACGTYTATARQAVPCWLPTGGLVLEYTTNLQALRRCERRNPLDNSAKRTLWRRFWAETVVAAISGSLCLITLLWPDWIEAASGWDPDQHDGAVEWAIVATLLL